MEDIIEKIDFVLPWVDASDPLWIESKAKHEDSNKDDKQTQTRFREMNTLKFVLRSIEKHCPWYNKIYLITVGHTPKWLNVSHPKIELITHEELFIDNEVLPVFNSNAIEMNLVNIKGLSNRFVHMNDDTVIINSLNKNRFFKNGKAVDFFHHGWIPRGKLFEQLKGKDTWIDALNNNLKLINRDFDSSSLSSKMLYNNSYSLKDKISNFIYKNFYRNIFWIKHWHHPQPYTKKTITSVYAKYSKEMIACSHNKFRSSSDITPYLYRYWHLINGDFSPYDYKDGFVAKITNFEYLKSNIKDLKDRSDINFVCFNDQMRNASDEEFKETTMVLEKYLETIFPTKASFEK